MGVSYLTEKRLKNLEDLPISDDLLQCNCTFNFDHLDFMATDISKVHLLVKKSILIKRDNPVLNKSNSY